MLTIVLATAVVLLSLGLLLGAGWLALRGYDVGRRAAYGQERIDALAAAYKDAQRLASSRARFRRRQQTVEQAFATGATGMESAHRSLAERFGSGYKASGFYDRVRRLNSQLGRGVSGLLAPESRKRSESLDDWEKRQSRHTPDASRQLERGRIIEGERLTDDLDEPSGRD